MKIKSKLILAASSLLVLSGVAAGTSTFAWFTANQSATVDVTSISVNTNTDELFMTAVAQDADIFTAEGTITGSDTTFAASSAADDYQLTDVSGNGVSLYKASVSTEGNVTGSRLATKAAPYCFDFNLTFTNSNTEKSMAVFLSSGSTISPTTATDANSALANSMRVAILNSDEDASLAYYAPNDSATTRIINAVNAVEYTSGFTAAEATEADLGLTTYTQNLLLSDYQVDYTDASATSTTSAKGYIGTIAAEDSLVVHARIWLEGTDADCTNTAQLGNAAVNLVFNGVSNIVA
jgi:hypothetical protein